MTEQPAPRRAFSCINEVDLFADLTPAEMDAFNQMAPLRRFTRGELVFNQYEPVTALFILKKGRVRIFRVAEDGRAFTISILNPGAVFGEMMLVGQRMYDNNAEALEACEVCTLSTADVENSLMSDPRIALRVSRLLGERVSELETRLADTTLLSLPARVASLLVRMADASSTTSLSNHFLVRLTHEQLAGLLGVTRESVSKTMTDLANRGLLKQRRGAAVLLDLPGLRRVASGVQLDASIQG